MYGPSVAENTREVPAGSVDQRSADDGKQRVRSHMKWLRSISSDARRGERVAATAAGSGRSAIRRVRAQARSARSVAPDRALDARVRGERVVGRLADDDECSTEAGRRQAGVAGHLGLEASWPAATTMPVEERWETTTVPIPGGRRSSATLAPPMLGLGVVL